MRALAMAALSEKALGGITSEFGVRPTMIGARKQTTKNGDWDAHPYPARHAHFCAGIGCA
jgi:hypothetical protein